MKKMLMSVISVVLVLCLVMPSVFAAEDTQTSYDSVIEYVNEAQATEEADLKIWFGRIVNGLSNLVITSFSFRVTFQRSHLQED